MSIDEIYQYVLFVMNKYQSGYLGGQEFTNLFNQEQTAYYDMLLGHVEQYQYGRPVPRVGINMTENVSTKMSPFLVPVTGDVVSSQQVAKPTGFGRLVAMRTDANAQIDRVEHDKKAYRISSEVLAGKPFYCEYAAYWEIWPTTISAVNYEYYPSKPALVNWGFTVFSERELFDIGNRIEPKWADKEIQAIIARKLKEMGVRFYEQQLKQLGQSII